MGHFTARLWLFGVYRADVVASIPLLPPIFAIFLGHFVFGESLSPTLLAAAGLVSCGIVMINLKVSARV